MKKVLAMILSLTLVVTLTIGGSIAYLTSEDSDVNVMTLGNVKIEQLEYERVDTSKTGDDAEVKEFENNKPLYPAVYENVPTAGQTVNDTIIKWDELGNVGSWNGIYNPDDIKNVQDKFVFVKNTGKSDAYVRTWFAFECGDLTAEEFDQYISTNITANDIWTWYPFEMTDWTIVEIDGHKYM